MFVAFCHHSIYPAKSRTSKRRSILPKPSNTGESTTGYVSKKADDNGYILILWDESGFSFVPNCVRTWAPIGHTPVLFETSGRHNHSGIGYITRTPRRHLLQFRFTMFKGSANTDDFIYFLTQIRRYYGKKAIIVWDNLSAHYAAENYFEDEHPGWFDFEYLPSHSPELNPVEQCWQQGKHVYLPNFVPTSEAELVEAVYQAMERINEEKLLQSFFKHAGLNL